MYLWNVEGLIRDFRTQKITEHQKLNYAITFAIIVLFLTYSILLFGTELSARTRKDLLCLELIMLSIVNVAGLKICFHANQRGDGRAFIERVMCLSLPLTIRSVMLALAFYTAIDGMGYLFLKRDIFESEIFRISETFSILVFDCIYYRWLYSAILKISEPTPS